MNTTDTTAPTANTAIVATITYALSAEGQKNALLAGSPAQRVQTVSGPISPDLLPLCTINADGTVSLALTGPQTFPPLPGCPDNLYPPVCQASYQSADEAVRAYAAWRDVTITQRQSESDAYVAKRAQRDAESAEQKRIYALKDAALKAEFEATAKRQAAEAAANAVAIAAWVRKYGDANMIERLEANLLPQAEIAQSMADYAFRSLDAYPLYRNITCEDIDDADTSSEAGPIYRSLPATGLTPGQWDALKLLRSDAAPGVVITPMLHEASRDDSDVPWGIVVRYSAKATATVAGVRVKREYAL